MARRIVRDFSGKMAVETRRKDWKKEIEHMFKTKGRTYPLPVGHHIFTKPQEYGARLLRPDYRKFPVNG